MRIALAQINTCLGDFSGNRAKILEYIHRGLEKRSDLIVFPEAALFGYHPVDLLERPSIVKAQEIELRKLHSQIPSGIAVVVGAIITNPKNHEKPYFNAAVLLKKGIKPKVFAKELLPTYDVFDEGRHIQPGRLEKNLFSLKGNKILVTICEDIWAWPVAGAAKFSKYGHNPLKRISASEVDVVINLSASPFTDSKLKKRQKVVAKTAAHLKAPLVYVNMVGAQDELIFDGGSFAVDKKGKLLAQSVRFEEDLNLVDLATGEGGFRKLANDAVESRRRALVLGIRDFVRKIGFEKVHLGLSGGVDSAVVACLAVDALGPQNVTCVGLPGPFNRPESLTEARRLANNLGTEWLEMSITGSYEKSLRTFETSIGPLEFGVVHENLQARTRQLLLMALSNLKGSMLLATSNKCEFATGYSTLYGDMAGGLCVIGDLLKGEVYDLAEHYNRERELIPRWIIDRPPSAELREDQKDQDSLPPYDELDQIVEDLVEGYKTPRGPLQKKMLQTLMNTEFKRWQAPPILKVSDHAFGRGRRLPVAHKAHY